MGNGSQQICPKLFILCMNSGLLLFQRNATVFHCQCAFTKDRQQDAVFKRIHGAFRQVDADNTKHTAACTNRKVQSFCIGAVIRRCTRTLLICKAPLRGTAFRRRIKTESAAFFHCVKNLPLSKRTILLWIHDQVPVQQFGKLRCRQG